jgi:hypothetical protein
MAFVGRTLALGLLLAACGSGPSPRHTTEKPEPGAPAAPTAPTSPTAPTEITSPTAPTQPAAVRPFDRMLVIVLENTDAAVALANPYLAALAARGARLTDYHALTHPSYPNYLAMIAGSTFGIRDDDQRTLDAATVGDLLAAKGLAWKVYAQGYPGGCFLGDAYGTYRRKHVPFLSFAGVQQSAACHQVVNADQWPADLRAGALPAFTMYIPDMNNDGHDTDVTFAAAWLQAFLEPLLADAAAMRGTLVVVTFDEASTASPDNRIYTVLLGPMVRPGSEWAERTDHYSLLRTLENDFALGPLGRGDAAAHPFSDVFQGR